DEDDDDDEEEEHSASADSILPPPTLRITTRISFRPQPPTPSFTKEEAERFLAMPIPTPSPLTPLSYPLPQIPSPPLPASPPILPIPLPTTSPPLQLLSSNRRTDRPEVTLPPRKRLSIVHRPGYEAGESSAAAAARPIEEYIPPEDDVFPAEVQPLPAAASPTVESPGYIPESDPDEDPKEDDDEGDFVWDFV
nr:hypothetical protein [Tanacetum cinerariifolium]